MSVVRSATAIEGMNPQDRLRVLAAAASVVSPIRPGMAKSFSREGLRIEQDLIQRGESPAVSMINSGAIDCRGVVSLVENIPAQRINAAEQSIIGGVTRCSQSLPAAQRLVATGLDQRSVAPRAVLAVMERTGLRSAWSQEQFEKLFASLPSNAEESAREAPNFAAMYARVAPEMTKDDASQAGLELLAWLTRLNASATRNLAVNITTDAMKSALGDAAYAHALATDVAAQQIAQTAGQKGEVEHHPEESASVLQALSRRGTDRFTELKAMAPSQRAREAAASGFAEGTDGDRNLAQQYFAVAFSALDELWKDRDAHPDAHLVIQEVSEAAAQVNPVAALKRTQQLSDPAAQAIGMVAVARVVANRPETSSASARERQSR
ncbi:MAG TPA: hypothetical protein VMU24_03325 [Candidatus Acidoferrales bacterium]|nr:hypothetical protein [Candidatus Acidoferrales bacterium]